MSLLSLKGNIIAFDTETTGLNPWGSMQRYGYFPARPFAFAFCDQYGNKAYIRFKVNPKTREVISNPRLIKKMSLILNNPEIIKVGHNLFFDIRMSRKLGILFNTKNIQDTQFMAHVFTGGSLFNYGLKELGKIWLDISDDDQIDLLNSVKSARRLAKKKGYKISTEKTHGKDYIKSDYWLGNKKLCKKYALQDAERTMLLYIILKKQFDLEENNGLKSIYKKEIKLSKLIYKMENRGVKIFKNKLKELNEFYANYRDTWLKKAYKRGGKNLNFNSPKQMIKKFIIDKKYAPLKFGNEVKKKAYFPEINEKKNPKVDGPFLKYLSDIKKDKLAKAILEHGAGQNMLTKFIKPYKKFMVKEKNIWILHPNYRQCGPVTGRLSCSDPNLMQVADEESSKKQADLGLKPRELFGPRKEHIWYLPDWSQMEVWIFAFQANDKLMMNALLDGEDFHSITAKHVWANEPDWKEKKRLYRKKGKTMMFLKQYGGGVYAASDLMKCSLQEAKEVINRFDDRLPGVKLFVDRMAIKAEKQGFILNPFGRKYIINPKASYKAVNYLVQGTCADIMKNAMIRLNKLFIKEYPGCHILMTLHDELIIEIPLKYHSKKLKQKIVKYMQKGYKKYGLPIPIPITMKTTTTKWSEAEKESQ